jgi:hypothetical protein
VSGRCGRALGGTILERETRIVAPPLSYFDAVFGKNPKPTIIFSNWLEFQHNKFKFSRLQETVVDKFDCFKRREAGRTVEG